MSSLRVISANARNRSLYEAREKGERDQRVGENAAEARGRLDGEARGEAQLLQKIKKLIRQSSSLKELEAKLG